MADRYKSARARQLIIDSLKRDLMGPGSPEEVLHEDAHKLFHLAKGVAP